MNPAEIKEIIVASINGTGMLGAGGLLFFAIKYAIKQLVPLITELLAKIASFEAKLETTLANANQVPKLKQDVDALFGRQRDLENRFEQKGF